MDFEEIPYPVKEYGEKYRALHKQHTEETFEELVRTARIDTTAIAELNRAIKKLRRSLEVLGASLGRLRFFRGFLILVAIAGFGCGVWFLVQLIFPDFANGMRLPFAWGAGGAAAGTIALLLILKWLSPRIRRSRELFNKMEELCSAKTGEAWRLMAPLNRLFRWDTIAGIVMKTLPIVTVDKFFSDRRMEQLCRQFFWDPCSRENESVLCCQSGALNGNPWVLAEVLRQEWETVTYTGYLEISWEEQVTYTDSDGKRHSRWETRYQTLTASVDEPAPVYRHRKFMVYGNEAAPELRFSRGPNALSDAGQGFFGRFRMRSAIKSLEARSRDLDDSFVIMDNRAFDACFNAADRDNEQQFRLLFTPLAQQEMLTLLRDRKFGFGDDFSFVKDHMINILVSDHLDKTDLAADPGRFRNYDFDALKESFFSYSENFFRSFYFTIAPLLCIPLYQQHRNFRDIYAGVLDSESGSFYEYESLVNAMVRREFAPEDAATELILKTGSGKAEGEAEKLHVTAHAFACEERLTYVRTRGGDGKWHDVPVHWKKYLPRSRTSEVIVAHAPEEETEPSAAEKYRKLVENFHGRVGTLRFRRSLLAFLREQ